MNQYNSEASLPRSRSRAYHKGIMGFTHLGDRGLEFPNEVVAPIVVIIITHNLIHKREGWRYKASSRQQGGWKDQAAHEKGPVQISILPWTQWVALSKPLPQPQCSPRHTCKMGITYLLLLEPVFLYTHTPLNTAYKFIKSTSYLKTLMIKHSRK